MIKRRKLLSVLSVIGVLAAGAGALLLLTSFKAEAVKVEQPVETRTVRTRTLIPGPQRLTMEADGFLTPARSLEIVTPVSGRVMSSKGGLKGGTPVHEGELILALDDRRAGLAFESARTELIRVSSGFVTNGGLNPDEKNTWASYLRELGAAAPSSLPAAPELNDRQVLLAATMGVVGARHTMDAAALDLLDHSISAPFSGTLTGDGVTEGAMLSSGQSLATLMETGRMEIALSLPAGDLAHFSLGDEVTVIRPEDGVEAKGVIARIEPVLTAASQTARAHAVLDLPEDAGWIPGAYVRVRIAGQVFADVYRVPRGVLTEGRLPVYRDAVLALIPVRVLAYDAGDVLLAADFPPGTEMVETVLQSPIEGLPLMKEGE